MKLYALYATFLNGKQVMLHKSTDKAHTRSYHRWANRNPDVMFCIDLTCNGSLLERIWENTND
jgi:hypothetical protein